MSTRDDILGRLRSQLGRTPANAADAAARVEATIAAPCSGPRPLQAAADACLAQFVERARAMISTVDFCDRDADVPARIARWLHAQALPADIVVAPGLGGLDWAPAGLRARIGVASGEDLVGVTGCFRAIAETGTLMLRSGADMPAVNSLLPETHIAVVYRDQIVADMESAWADARQAWSRWPRAVNFVSGPSRTADIEQTIVLGAHGPYRVHLLIVGATETGQRAE